MEERLYQGVKKALTAYLRQADDNFPIMLEITADRFPESLKPHIQRELLFLLENKDLRPDFLGHIGPNCTSTYGTSEFIMTVEVKPKEFTLRDIFQAKMYGEVYSVPFAFLIFTELPKHRLLELVRLRRDFLAYSAGLQTLYIARYSKHDETLDWWFDKREPRNKEAQLFHGHSSLIHGLS